MPASTLPPLITALLDPQVYKDHLVDSVELVQTHSAWILLTGQFAYKIKKPVNFGFLDFSTLQKRRENCEKELHLNRRLAPQIYLAVVAITGSETHPEFDDEAASAIEYAVKMRQFPSGQLLSSLADKNQLGVDQIDALCHSIVEFHRQAERAELDSDFGDATRIFHWTEENFEHINAYSLQGDDEEKLARLSDWVNATQLKLKATMQQRLAQGWVRNCHGDLHLGNLTRLNGQVIAFDCIEFNDELRWIDLISEVAFLLMDLKQRGLDQLANRFLNNYLQANGDYPGLALLDYYQVYRALVRAKVALLRQAQLAADSIPTQHCYAEFQHYLNYATQCTRPRRPHLIMMHGVSGSGKSTLATRVAEYYGFLQLRSDVERKRLSGLSAGQASHSALDEDLYSQQQNDKTYQHLLALAAKLINAGYTPILDATFLTAKYREAVMRLAAEKQCPMLILCCEASDTTLQQRVATRQFEEVDASEATLEVLARQQQQIQPLSTAELAITIRVNTGTTDHWSQLQGELDKRIR